MLNIHIYIFSAGNDWERRRNNILLLFFPPPLLCPFLIDRLSCGWNSHDSLRPASIYILFLVARRALGGLFWLLCTRACVHNISQETPPWEVSCSGSWTAS